MIDNSYLEKKGEKKKSGHKKKRMKKENGFQPAGLGGRKTVGCRKTERIAGKQSGSLETEATSHGQETRRDK